MKILALNGSPRGRNSNTNLLLEPFLAGARQAGAQTEIVYAADLDIKDCIGCFSCWNKTPGRCILQDDMPAVLEKIKDAGLVVWATPLYHYGMTARLKRIMERTLPLCKPYIVKIGAHYSHPPRYPERRTGNFLLSNCGFPERHHFDALVEQFRHLTSDREPLIGAIMCPAGEILKHVDCQWYFDAVRSAGAEVVRNGMIADQTMAVLAKDIIPPEFFVVRANESWEVPGDAPPTLTEALAGARQGCNA